MYDWFSYGLYIFYVFRAIFFLQSSFEKAKNLWKLEKGFLEEQFLVWEIKGRILEEIERGTKNKEVEVIEGKKITQKSF